MAIPESQLETWSNRGATTTAEQTHNSIRNAFESYTWPTDILYDVYLQGSYRNFTNIRGNSDVDLVVELTSVFYSNLTQEERRKMGYVPATYGWNDFRKDVIAALTNYYGTKLIDTSGAKSIKVLPASGRLAADVVVCVKYKYFSQLSLTAEGITFFTSPDHQQIINYPKQHYDNGANKNSQYRTKEWYKPCVRMFKNARNRIVDNQPDLKGLFPSYFVECLLYNVPDNNFGTSFQETYKNVVTWLDSQFASQNTSAFMCQNEISYLFGDESVQWDVSAAHNYVNHLIKLWNDW